jgi:hypothetical protein
MVLWIIAVPVYLTVGFILVCVGPAARLLDRVDEKLGPPRRERLLYLIAGVDDEGRWKRSAFLNAITLGIITLWPVFILLAAAVSERRSVGPPLDVERCIASIREQFSSCLPLSAYKEIISRLSWRDHEHFDYRLGQLGYSVTGFLIGLDRRERQDFSVRPSVLRVGVPFALTKLRGRAEMLSDDCKSPDPSRLPFRCQPKPDDEVWEFATPPETWSRLCGRAGLALVRGTTVIDVYVKVMN